MKKQLAKYLSELDENFSGFDGNMEYDMGFDGAEDLNATGEMGCAVPDRTAQPYTITYSSNSATTGGTFILFGSNRYADAVNYGSNAGISIVVGGGASSYAELLAQVATNPVKVNRWRFIGEAADIAQTLTATYRNANGSQIIQTLPLAIYTDMYAYSTTVLDVDFSAKVDGTFFLQGTIAAASKSLTIVVFPEAIVDNSRLMNNQQAIRTFNRPILSAAIANPTPKNVGISKKKLLGY